MKLETGRKLVFVNQEILLTLQRASLVYEVMDTEGRLPNL